MKAIAAKSRLSPALSLGQRQRLSELMLLDVLDAFADAGLLAQCRVVSSSRRVRVLTQQAGALPVAESSDNGVNAAVKNGTKRAKSDLVMVVPSDLPLLKASEIVEALSFLSAGFEAIITPSMDFDGTNLLVFSRLKPFPLSFDRNSFWNHLRSASRHGLKVCVCSAAGFRFDVDSVSQLGKLAAARSGKRSVDFATEALHK